MIKSFIRKFIRYTSSWFIMKPFKGIIFFLYHEWFILKDLLDKEKRISNLIKADLFQSGTVMHGPFKGMHYPMMQSAGSSLFPKLLGTYEKELQEVIELCTTKQYAEIIDIGCAEGYYAVGLALKIPNSTVYAFDTDPHARQLCKKMAEANGVEDRVFIKGTCTPEMLENFPFSGKGLLICDCEGFESKLFTRENLFHLRNCDIIIETHDFINLHISAKLKELIAPTHVIKSIYSTDDIQKVHQYQLEELKKYSLEDRKDMLSEERPCIMEWLICTGKG